jgi:hypothetical protein
MVAASTSRQRARAPPAAFFRDTLPAYIARLPWFGRAARPRLPGTVAGHILHQPEIAAARPVFELRAAD